MQRYAAFLWSGDVYSTWETLKTHVPIAINTALTGIPYWGTDIGGFVPTKELTGELYVRWFQFGAFCPLVPLARPDLEAPAPLGLEYRRAGPERDPDLRRRRQSRPRGAAQRGRRADLPQVPGAALSADALPLQRRPRGLHETGLPIIRALWLHDPDDPAAVARGDEYLWGRDILVAPVTEKGATSRRLYLPRGTLVRLLDRGERSRAAARSTGPSTWRPSPCTSGPGRSSRWVRSSNTPTRPSDGPLTLRIYPGADGHFPLYEDDGISFGYRKGDWMGIDLAWDDPAAG